MGLNDKKALVLAMRLVLFNSEVIYYVKNSLLEKTIEISNILNQEYEKFKVIINNSYPNIDYKLILANTTNNNNHDVTKLDVGLIKDVLMESYDESSN